MIEVKNLTKKYGNFCAVNNLSFTIEKGKIYGFLGPNGAGKSTTMNIVTGCLSATGGRVLVDGVDIFENPLAAKKKIGYLPELPPLYTEMTPAEYLTFVAEAKGVDYEEAPRQIREVMELTQITHVSDRLIRNLSKGYRQRVGIAQALLGHPEIIILDEPTVGLDPKQIIEIRELIRSLGKTKTVIVSSHILAEISAVCDHVMILSRGCLVANDSLANLEESAMADATLHLTVKGNADAVTALLSEIDGVRGVKLENSDGKICHVSLDTDPSCDPRDRIFYTLADKKMSLVEMYVKHASLEDIFLRLTSDEEVSEECPTIERHEHSVPNETECKGGDVK
ncbi:MAG: ABC transporter ATP-binding protein [Ruminococcaceae bacterium]|nr:ABC transporter ATP-binding protein [Oscillospiraceae bacterium]